MHSKHCVLESNAIKISKVFAIWSDNYSRTKNDGSYAGAKIMYTGKSYLFTTAIEQQAFHEGLKAAASSQNPYLKANSPHAARAWGKGNELGFRLSARLGVQYLNAAKI